MGLFESIFGNGAKTDKAMQGYFTTLNAYQPRFYSRSGGLYEMDTTRAAIHSIATHCSKLTPHVIGKAYPELELILKNRPNPWQNTTQFLYRLATILEVENTAFLVPIIDWKRSTKERSKVVGVFPVVPQMCELMEGADKKLYLRYQFQGGKYASIDWDLCGVMTKMQFKSDFFGEDNRALSPTLDLLSVQNQGIQEGIKSSAALRFMAKLGQSLRPEDIEAEQKRFRELNFSSHNNGGVLIYDTKYADVKQIDSKPYVVDADQMKLINENVYNYFGVNEKILRNEWDEQQWSAFYEGKIEPFALQLSLVLTNMFFSAREYSFGNEVQFSANRLQFATIPNKISYITQLFDRGMLTINEAREVMQMPTVEGGDVRMIRGEYVNWKDREEAKNVNIEEIESNE